MKQQTNRQPKRSGATKESAAVAGTRLRRKDEELNRLLLEIVLEALYIIKEMQAEVESIQRELASAEQPKQQP